MLLVLLSKVYAKLLFLSVLFGIVFLLDIIKMYINHNNVDAALAGRASSQIFSVKESTTPLNPHYFTYTG